MNRLAAVLLCAALLVSPSLVLGESHGTSPVVQGQLHLYATEDAAQQRHCPRDVVVWLNTNSGIYHKKGMRWYGRTKHGAYVCRKEADAAGDRDTENGQ